MEQFEFTGKHRMFTIVLALIGVALMGIGFVTGTVTGQRVWADLLANGLLFFFVALAAVFFISVQYAAESGWPTLLKRVYEATAAWLPIGSVIILIVFIAGFAHMHHLYHWMGPFKRPRLAITALSHWHASSWPWPMCPFNLMPMALWARQ